MDEYIKFLALVRFYEPIFLRKKANKENDSERSAIRKGVSKAGNVLGWMLTLGDKCESPFDRMVEQSSRAKKELLLLLSAGKSNLKKEEAEVYELLSKYNRQEKEGVGLVFNSEFINITLEFHDWLKLIGSEKGFDKLQENLNSTIPQHPFINDETYKLFLYLSMDDYKQDIIRFSYIYNFLIDSSIDKSLPESEYFKFIKREVYPELKTTRLNQHATNERRVKKLEESYRKYVKSKDV